MEAETKELKQKQAQSSARSVALEIEARKSSPVRTVRNNDKENISPVKSRADPKSKDKKVISETVRQSPRKKLTALVKSTSAKFQSSVSRTSDSITEEDLEQDNNLYKEARKVTSLKGNKKDAKSKQAETVEENSHVDEMEVEETIPKKKTSILSRAKKSTGKMTAQSTRRSEEQARIVETELETQQTPVIAARKSKGKVQPVVAEESVEEASFVNATPIVKPKVKKVAAANLEETAKVTKKRGAIVEEQADVEDSIEPISSEDGVQKKKKRRILKQNTNIANGFLDGNVSGDLDPKLNLPLQLSPIKGAAPSTSLGTRGGASGRIFGR